MKAIVMVDKNWGIGKDNALLIKLPPDMAHFKRHTMGNVVVMGKNTLLSFPNGKPLPNRVNIVLSTTIADGDYVKVDSLSALKTELMKYDPDKVYVIGGASIYKLMLPYCEKIIVTKVDAVKDADAFFENLDLNPDFELTEEGEEQDYEGLKFRFTVYENKNVKEL